MMDEFPIHPSLVHFPIAFYFLETLLIYWWALGNRDDYHGFARFAFFAAFISMWFALGTGLYTAGGIPPAWKHARTHFLSALSTTVFYSGRCFFWNSPAKNSKRWHLVQVSLGLALVFLTGYFGGELTHGDEHE